MPNKNKNGEIIFPGYPEFIPNLTPIEIFSLGSFGGTYWRPITSSVTHQHYENIHMDYPSNWWKNIPNSSLIRPWGDYAKEVNKYGVKVGTTLEYWESKGWIDSLHPYGWVHWYCDFYNGLRGDDDERQIKRWVRTGCPKSRFRRAVINLIIKKNSVYNDFSIRPKRRQTLQHWGYVLTKKDCV